MMKNRLSDLNNHLFAQIERLSEEGISEAALDRESKRTEAIVKTADQIVKTAELGIRAAKVVCDFGANPGPFLETIQESPVPLSVPAKPNGTPTDNRKSDQ